MNTVIPSRGFVQHDNPSPWATGRRTFYEGMDVARVLYAVRQVTRDKLVSAGLATDAPSEGYYYTGNYVAEETKALWVELTNPTVVAMLDDYCKPGMREIPWDEFLAAVREALK